MFSTRAVRSLAHLLAERPQVIVERQLEPLTVFLGLEQANYYTLATTSAPFPTYAHSKQSGTMPALPPPEPIGHLVEYEYPRHFLMRQLLRNRRSFRVDIATPTGIRVLSIERPISWLRSHVRVYSYTKDTPTLIGEIRQLFHMWRRRYQLYSFHNGTLAPLGYIDEGIAAWDFRVRDDDGVFASINREFVGFTRESFTDSGRYNVRFYPHQDDFYESPSMEQSERQLGLHDRAVLLGCAVSIDFDYFSRMRKRQMAIASAAYETYSVATQASEQQETQIDTEWVHDTDDGGGMDDK